jgi:hypothetical protein
VIDEVVRQELHLPFPTPCLSSHSGVPLPRHGIVSPQADKMKDLFLGTALALFGLVAAAPAPRPLPPSPVLEERVANPTVTMSSGGSVVGTSNSITEAFNGIPFASPPTGQLRLKPPVKRNSSTLAAFDATGLAAACPQFFVSTGSNDLISEILSTVVDLPFFQTVTNQNEDCLNLNVVRPAGTTAGDNLPVLFWIFGGAFEVSP